MDPHDQALSSFRSFLEQLGDVDAASFLAGLVICTAVLVAGYFLGRYVERHHR
jgi:hypothetical protein